VGITAISLHHLDGATVETFTFSLRTRILKTGMIGMLLKWLWVAIACPVLDELGFQHFPTSEQWPRICWIPTGPLCLLPIHAAGEYAGSSGNTVLDRVISSYSPSVKALLYAHHNKIQQNRNNTLNKAVLISMEKTPGLSANSFLPSVMKEIEEVRELLDPTMETVALREPQKADILDNLNGCKVFLATEHHILQTHPKAAYLPQIGRRTH
jgi:hypothetical protein